MKTVSNHIRDFGQKGLVAFTTKTLSVEILILSDVCLRLTKTTLQIGALFAVSAELCVHVALYQFIQFE